MKQLSIVYFSGTGHTAKMAEAIQRGAQLVPNVVAELRPILGTDIKEGRFTNAALLDQLTQSDGIILGTPTYLGGPAAQFKAFVDATGSHWYRREWAGKIAAGFTHSGSPSGDKLSTLQYLSLFAAQHGMIWVGNEPLPPAGAGGNGVNRAGAFLGAMGYGRDPAEVDPGDLRTAELLGQRVASVAVAFVRQPEIAAA